MWEKLNGLLSFKIYKAIIFIGDMNCALLNKETINKMKR